MTGAAGPRRWCAELLLGVRLSAAGGRAGWTRLALVAAGVGLGVAVLLTVAAVPTAVAAREARLAARAVDAAAAPPRGPDTLLTAAVRTDHRGRSITGLLVQPEGARAPLPPGLTRPLGPGEMAASPALARLLADEEGALLRGRWDERVVAVIGDAGLAGPGEHVFYLGTDRLTEDTAIRVREFGRAGVDEGVPPELVLLWAVGLVVLLVPVAVFVSTAVRSGGEARDRRLAALRLLGADAAATRRIAAGETLAGALLGLAAGALLHLAAVAPAARLLPPGLTVPAADLRPVPALALLVAVLVPVASVLVTVAALRRVVVEPLGVARRGAVRRRRLGWRLLPPAAGAALLLALPADALAADDDRFAVPLAVGVAALLAGVALLLPWVVEAVVRRLGGGGVAWQLAVRRLQAEGGTAVRAAAGIAVSVAGVIAFQAVLAALHEQYALEIERGTGPFQAQVWGPGVDDGRRWAGLGTVPGVRAVGTEAVVTAVPVGPGPPGPRAGVDVVVGGCPVLRQSGALGPCTDGDVFVVGGESGAQPRPGGVYAIGGPDAAATRWTLPAGARTVTGTGGPADGHPRILATPGALAGVGPAAELRSVYVALDAADPDALDRVRDAVARLDPTAAVDAVPRRYLEAALAGTRQAAVVGAAVLLLLVGAGLLVDVAEQLRERRRPFAVLVAAGTRRAVLTGSVLHQVAVPVLLGLVLAVVAGGGLAAALLTAMGVPVRLDWAAIGTTVAAAVLVVLLTTAASLPLLRRATDPGGLRSE